MKQLTPLFVAFLMLSFATTLLAQPLERFNDPSFENTDAPPGSYVSSFGSNSQWGPGLTVVEPFLLPDLHQRPGHCFRDP